MTCHITLALGMLHSDLIFASHTLNRDVTVYFYFNLISKECYLFLTWCKPTSKALELLWPLLSTLGLLVKSFRQPERKVDLISLSLPVSKVLFS